MIYHLIFRLDLVILKQALIVCECDQMIPLLNVAITFAMNSQTSLHLFIIDYDDDNNVEEKKTTFCIRKEIRCKSALD